MVMTMAARSLWWWAEGEIWQRIFGAEVLDCIWWCCFGLGLMCNAKIAQRSRRALLQRRALEKAVGRNHLYKVSLSFVIVLWGLVFLLNLWIGYGDGHRDIDGGASNVLSDNASTMDDAKFASTSALGSVAEEEMIKQVCDEHSFKSSASVDSDTEDRIEQQIKAGKEITSDVSGSESQQVNMEGGGSERNLGRRDALKNGRMARVADLAFDEFKNKEINSKTKYVSGSAGGVIHRVEPGGAEYNYASSGKGAKVLEFNKESKGASNILVKDQDKYLRNPCSAEEKFVIVELSEETLVSTIQIANFEHYSSNLKQFELLGSLVYPTDTWVKLGNFTAGNVRHAQRFPLPEPQWTRYLKLNLLSHYGSEFYCTVSSLEVYGVDAVERMLEDLIADPGNLHSSGEVRSEHEQFPTEPLSVEHDDVNQSLSHDAELHSHPEGSSSRHETTVHHGPEVEEVHHQQVSRMPSDTVLKILMQKVRALDLNFSVLERYLEELNSRYRNIFKEFDEEMVEKDMVLERIRLDIKSFFNSKDVITKDVGDLVSWKSQVSTQLDVILKENAILRSEVRKVQEKQMYMESKGILVFTVSLAFGIIALIALCINTVLNICGSEKSRKFCSTNSSWIFLLMSCITIIIILSL